MSILHEFPINYVLTMGAIFMGITLVVVLIDVIEKTWGQK